MCLAFADNVVLEVGWFHARLRWKLVRVTRAVFTAVLGIGFTQVRFANREASYLSPSSQVAIDNVEYQSNSVARQ